MSNILPLIFNISQVFILALSVCTKWPVFTEDMSVYIGASQSHIFMQMSNDVNNIFTKKCREYGSSC